MSFDLKHECAYLKHLKMYKETSSKLTYLLCLMNECYDVLF